MINEGKTNATYPCNKPSGRFQFSLTGLLSIIFAVALLMSSYRSFGLQGGVWSSFISIAILGKLAKRPDWLFFGLTLAALFSSIIVGAWVSHGQLGTVNYDYLSTISRDSYDIHEAIKAFKKQNIPPPEDLSKWQLPVSYSLTYRTDRYRLQMDRGTPRIFCFGADNREGGLHENADFWLDDFTEHFKKRVPFTVFVRETAGLSNFSMLGIITVIMLLVTPNQGNQRLLKISKSEIVAYVGCFSLALIVGIFMAGFYIVASQSSH